jgi:hypothetical protein
MKDAVVKKSYIPVIESSSCSKISTADFDIVGVRLSVLSMVSATGCLIYPEILSSVALVE